MRQIGVRVMTVGAALLLAALQGCGVPRVTPPAPPPHVTVKDLADPSIVQHSAAMDPAAVTHRFIAQRMILERDSPRFALATAMLKPVEVDAEAAALWAANNLRIGKLERNRVPLFMANLPKPLSTDVVHIFNPTLYSPLTLIDRNETVQRVRLMATNGRARLIRLVGGQHQLLLKVIPPIDPSLGPAKLRVVPHHEGLGTTLLPGAGAGARTLDNARFQEFQIDLPIDEDHIWVIWADELAEAATGDDPLQNLGSAMLSGDLRNDPVQAVVMIATEK